MDVTSENCIRCAKNILLLFVTGQIGPSSPMFSAEVLWKVCRVIWSSHHCDIKSFPHKCDFTQPRFNSNVSSIKCIPLQWGVANKRLHNSFQFPLFRERQINFPPFIGLVMEQYHLARLIFVVEMLKVTANLLNTTKAYHILPNVITAGLKKK